MSEILKNIIDRNPNEPNFIQAVTEVAEDVVPYMNKHHPEYIEKKVFERLSEPDRVITFRVSWVDDNGTVQNNRGFRIQHNDTIGPYKGGLRFHPTVDLDTLKFLAFEQTFKNSLTGLPMGGAKGGADFDPKGKSDNEIMRFCKAYMDCLYRYIGSHVDVPAGDIGVSGKEIGYMVGQYRRLTNEAGTGFMTGKPIPLGGSLGRTEATGYGAVYFLQNMLEYHGIILKDKTAVVSGSGNVSVYAAEKLIELGSKVVTLSDSSGYIYDSDGIDQAKLDWIKDLKFTRKGRISEYVNQYPNATFIADATPWSVPCDVALPCATQNELTLDDAKMLISNGLIGLSEGANMPSTNDAVKEFIDNGVLYAPGKASNAGGVAVSGLEMTQNSMRMSWTAEEVDAKLKDIMLNIHLRCVEYGTVNNKVNYRLGANIAGFDKVAQAVLASGVV